MNSIRKRTYKSIFNITAEVFLFLCIFVPTTYSSVRLISLIVFFIDAIVVACQQKLPISCPGFFILLLSLVYSMISIVNGVILQAPGALECMKTDFFWPIMLYLSLSIWVEKNELCNIIRFIIIVCSIVVVWDFWYCASHVSPLPFPAPFQALKFDYNFKNLGMLFQFTTNHMVSYMFITPFTISLLMCGASEEYISKRYLLFTFLLELALVYFSGRVAFVLSCILSIPVTFVLLRFCHKSVRFRLTKKKLGRILTVVAGSVIIFFVGLHLSKSLFKQKLSGIADYATMKLAGTLNGSTDLRETNLRYIQTKYLLEGWHEKPLIGHGTGSYHPAIIRGEGKILWAYESAYAARLYQQGLLGLFFYLLPMIWTVISLCLQARRGDITVQAAIPISVGLICMLMVNGVDPYLNTMGAQWMIYLPFAFAMKQTIRRYNVRYQRQDLPVGI
jgi:hypothetical protein